MTGGNSPKARESGAFYLPLRSSPHSELIGCKQGRTPQTCASGAHVGRSQFSKFDVRLTLTKEAQSTRAGGGLPGGADRPTGPLRMHKDRDYACIRHR